MKLNIFTQNSEQTQYDLYEIYKKKKYNFVVIGRL